MPKGHPRARLNMKALALTQPTQWRPEVISTFTPPPPPDVGPTPRPHPETPTLHPKPPQPRWTALQPVRRSASPPVKLHCLATHLAAHTHSTHTPLKGVPHECVPPLAWPALTAQTGCIADTCKQNLTGRCCLTIRLPRQPSYEDERLSELWAALRWLLAGAWPATCERRPRDGPCRRVTRLTGAPDILIWITGASLLLAGVIALPDRACEFACEVRPGVGVTWVPPRPDDGRDFFIQLYDTYYTVHERFTGLPQEFNRAPPATTATSCTPTINPARGEHCASYTCSTSTQENRGSLNNILGHSAAQ